MSLRSLLTAAATGMILFAVVFAAGSQTDDVRPPVAFFVIGDTHILADRKQADRVDPRSADLNFALVEAMNQLAGKEIPKSAGGGLVQAARGVIHAGDIIDTGDQANVKAQKTEWDLVQAAFGLQGNDGKLKFPIYEVHGNHDSPRGDGFAVQQIIERNKKRPGVTHLSKNGLHYSWDWDNVHFINLGIVVGQGDGVTARRRYDPRGSLEFLVADLKDKVGDSGRPVIITHHVDMLRYSQPPAEKKIAGSEWDPEDVSAFHAALKGYNIAAIFYGHTHARNVFLWDGSPKPAKSGVAVFNVTKSAHYAGANQGLFYVEVRDGSLMVREYQTKDGWATGTWTPQVWAASFAKTSK